MWICRLLHKSFSSAKLAAVSNEKNKLQSFVANLILSGQFSRETDIIPYEESSLFDFPSYFKHFSSITAGLLSSSSSPSFGETLLVADKIPTTMKILDSDCATDGNGNNAGHGLVVY
ncbi:unnamed protein product [Adineta steineri]|uniref:Uncharacterized protein n=1 Tax=Adineta steineri TaxID=433720 RepID=A0A818S3J8_9BILA|nr:unnamed protein product [Adineta steineri]CAF3660406.1 unnamed protein product [Adineta steineri]